jgi:hypothetical protein
VVFSQILWGSLGLSLIHAAIPNHWVPLVVISQTEQWSRFETMWATILTGFAHIASTILIGISIGFLGYRLASSYEAIARIVIPTVLLLLGLLYLFMSFWGTHQHQLDSRVSSEQMVRSIDNVSNSLGEQPVSSKRPRLAILASLGTAMFFSPCIELSAYYFAAGTIGWLAIAAVSLIYLCVTILGMNLLVALGCKGIERLKVKLDFLERYEATLTGGILIISGVSTFLINI